MTAQPPYLHEPYRSTVLRAPTQPLLKLPADLGGPRFDTNVLRPHDSDLTRNARQGGEPLGERIVVTGRVLDEDGRPLAGELIEIWQANAAGRYVHATDQHDAPLDPNFIGAGRCITDDDGGYRFFTIKPGAYPWRNHANAWRPNHIHLSLFGRGVASRLVTQMYFPGDPLHDHDPIFQGVPEPVRSRLIARFDLAVTEPEFALGYVFDIVLRRTPFES